MPVESIEPAQNVFVVKLGGSLLSRDDLADRYARVIEQLPAERLLVVAGGGPVADIVRDWHDRFGLSEAISHRIAMGSMSLTAKLLAAILPQSTLATTRGDAAAGWKLTRTVILDADVFVHVEQAALRGTEQEDFKLPHSWRVTSDSVAAWVARRWPARCLLLLKSTAIGDRTIASAAASGLVDGWFPDAISDSELDLQWCNLTVDEPLPQAIPRG